MWKPSYVELDVMKDWLRDNDPGDIDDDPTISLHISAASRAVDTAAGRQFGKADSAQERIYPLRWSRALGAHVAEIDDLMDLTGLTFSTDDGTTTLTTDKYKLMPRNAVVDGLAFTYVVICDGVNGCGCGFGFPFDFGLVHHHPELTMTGLPGWTTIPDAVVEATKLQVGRLNIRRDSPYGVAGSPDAGSEMRLLSQLDPDIAPVLAHYVRTGWVAR